MRSRSALVTSFLCSSTAGSAVGAKLATPGPTQKKRRRCNIDRKYMWKDIGKFTCIHIHCDQIYTAQHTSIKIIVRPISGWHNELDSPGTNAVSLIGVSNTQLIDAYSCGTCIDHSHRQYYLCLHDVPKVHFTKAMIRIRVKDR